MLKVFREIRKLRKENADLRKAIEEALRDLKDVDCMNKSIVIMSASIRLERALGKDPEERPLRRIQKKVIVYHSLIVRQIGRKSNEKI